MQSCAGGNGGNGPNRDEEKLHREKMDALRRREEGILLMKHYVFEKVSKRTGEVVKVWKIFVFGKNCEIFSFKIFECLNCRVFQFTNFRISELRFRCPDSEKVNPSKVFYHQKLHKNVMVNHLFRHGFHAEQGKHNVIVYNYDLKIFNFHVFTQNVSEAKRRQREAHDRLLRLQRERREDKGEDKDQFSCGAARNP